MTLTKGRTAEHALREALKRLLSGRAAHTDGRLTVANLAREAGLSRATVYRCPGIVDTFQTEMRKRSGSPAASTVHRHKVATLDAELADLQARAREDRRTLEATVNAMAQRIQALTLLTKEQERQITDLHEALSRSGVVTPLHKRKPD